MTGLRLSTGRELQQLHPAPDYFYVVTRRELRRLGEEPPFFRRVENHHPFQMFFSRQHKRQRFEMRVDEEQERRVADRFALEIQDVDRVAAEQDFDRADE